MLQVNLGDALMVLGARKTGTTRLDEAFAAFNEALKELTKEVAPYLHHIAQKKMAACLKLLELRRKK